MSEELVGSVLGHFRIVRKLGAGGMGVVYEAADEKLRRRVAIKVLPARFGEDDELRARMLREARSAAAVTHPGIAAVYEVGESEGRVFIAMELVDGETLRRRIGELGVEEAVALGRAIARALACAHEAGVVHRDLKPENVMVTTRREVKVLDFGLAKVEEGVTEPDALEQADTASVLTQAGRVMGTPGYMSPEQARGQSVDARTDVFSFGVVLYEMLTGICPFRGDSTADVLASVMRDEPAAVESVNRAVVAPLGRIVARCMAKAREDRFASGVELAAALDALPERAPARSKLGWVIAAGVLVLGAGVVFATRTPSAEPVATHPPAPTVLATALAMTDAPPPKSENAEAAAVYRASLQAFRDGSMLTAAEGFERAAKMEPGFAAAHLRAGLYRITSLDESRRAYESASQQRKILDERDASLLRLLETFVLGETPDFDRIVGRAKETADRFPHDAEIVFNLGEALRWAGRTDEALRAYERALELDGEFAMTLWGVALIQSDRAQFEDSLRTVERCLEIVPTAASCLRTRARVHRAIGACDRFEEDAVRIIGIDPRNDSGPLFLAQALAAQGKPRKAVADALAKHVSLLEPEDRPIIEKVNEARLLLLEGDLAGAEAVGRVVEKMDTDRGAESDYSGMVRALLLLYEETGETDRAADRAQAYLEGLPGWTKDSPFNARPLVLAALVRAGRMSPSEADAQRAEWLSRGLGGRWDHSGLEWVSFFAEPAATKAEADAALAKLSKYGAPPPAYTSDNMTWGEGAVGSAYFHAGRFDEAIPWLRGLGESCLILLAPLEYMRARGLLGRALEQKGDKAGACEAYRVVLERWAHPRPSKLLTHEAAREGRERLGCGK